MAEPLPSLPPGLEPDPEFRLLLACSWRPQGPLAAAQAARIAALLAGGIRWERLLYLVDRHRLGNLAYQNLQAQGAAGFPETARTALRARARKEATDSLRHTGELLRLQKSALEQGLELLPLKGPALSQRLYQDPSCRSLHDLDLMILPEDLQRADLWLKGDGYRRIAPELELGPRLLAVYQKRCHHFCYVHEQRQIMVELHWRFHAWSPGQVALLWDHSPSRPAFSGASLRQLDDDALLMLLCEHGGDHWWFRLKWLSDVAMLLADKSPDSWARTLEQAELFAVKPVLAQALLLCHWLYQVALVEPARGLIQELPEAGWLAGQGLLALYAPGDPASRTSIVMLWKRHRYGSVIGHGRSWLGQIALLGIRPEDAEYLPLPDSLYFLYYLVRPFSLVWRRLRRAK